MKQSDLEKIRSVYEIYLNGGSKNEKKIAKDILDKFCIIYSLSFQELILKIGNINKNEEHFEIPKDYNNLVYQIIYKVMGHMNFKINNTFSKKKNYIILECTSEEKNEINKLIDFYTPIYKKDLENFLKEKEKEFFKAFVHKNRIIPEDKIMDISNISGEGLLELLKLYETMEKIEKYTITEENKQLNPNLKLC